MAKGTIFFHKALEIYYNLLGFDDNVGDREPGRFTCEEKIDKDDYHGHIFSALSDKFYHLYCVTIIFKDLWNIFKRNMRKRM